MDDLRFSRLSQFNDRLQSLTQSIATDKKHTTKRYEVVLGQLTEKFTEMSRTRELTHNSVETGITRMKKDITALTASVAKQELFQDELVNARHTLERTVQQTTNERRSGEEHIIGTIEGKLQELADELNGDVEAGRMAVNRRGQAVASDLKRLGCELSEETEQGANQHADLEQVLDTQLAGLRRAIQEDGQQAAQTRAELQGRMEALAKSLAETLDAEVEARTENEGILLNLLEATCFKINEARAL